MNELHAPKKPVLSSSDIYSELGKVLLFRGFAKSAVLSKFIRFVVEETVLGRAAAIKEYTISLNILKSQPSAIGGNSIVRTHAVRLRKLLELYYRTDGRYNSMRITIPKGSYVPVIKTFDPYFQNFLGNADGITVLAVFPLKSFHANPYAAMLCSFLAEEISAGLSAYGNITVLGYHRAEILRIYEEDVCKAACAVGADFFVTGNFYIYNECVHMEIELWKTGGTAVLVEVLREPLAPEPHISEGLASAILGLVQSFYHGLAECEK